MIEKTLSTFHSSNMVLQQQYREMGFKTYSELIGHLLVAKQYNDLLIKNNETRPPGTAPFSEVNAANFHPTWRERNPDLSRGRGRGRGRDRGGYFNQGNRLAINNNLSTSSAKRGVKLLKQRQGRTLKVDVIDVEERDTGSVAVVRLSIW
ncbi:uncharacterized protein LOC124887633 [Capsicum annuum]|uniref:uncharacterized protein LOC124887633 n=1 Tax=Capsicum annuum TaxID=4072 RepID=UPI001FB04BF3|nr:uncharacterized protein LOC124887633 [Capsicum annuum]